MIFRQVFDSVSGTYTYLIASRHGGEALIIDPVMEKVDRYLSRSFRSVLPGNLVSKIVPAGATFTGKEIST